MYMQEYKRWMEAELEDFDLKAELQSIEGDEGAIEDRFAVSLKFGTAGLRGTLGAGTNRMNKYTVGKATAGLGKYLLDTYGAEVCRERGVAIGYDTRNNSSYLSRVAADVLSGMGIRVYLLADARPTPQLSFTVKSSTVLDKYCYEFVRLDDRRVMVTFYLEDDEGNKTQRVSDFYITDFAFKKIVYSYTSLLSGKAFDADTAYGD